MNKRILQSIALIAGVLCLAGSALGIGPDAVARSDRSLWPHSLHTPQGFDRASRAEILTYAQALAETENLSDEAWRSRLHLKQIDHAHLLHMRDIYWQRIARNYALASAGCGATEPFCPPAPDVAALKQASANFGSFRDPREQAWYANAIVFHRTYLDEQLRLAALFPHISSEVDTFNRNEFSGGEFADREFFLSFDDGPTAAGGNTEKLLAVLRAAHLDATFFVLGGNLAARAKQTSGTPVADLYQGMCVGMHGWEHQSHASWPQWQDSVIRSTALVRDTIGASFAPLFRPPYGQRKADSEAFFREQHLAVALWNIDSQDWNATVTAAEAGQRVLTLMLLWRHGVVLFHDIHPKAQSDVPYLLAQTQGTDIAWKPCHELAATGAARP